MKSLLALLVPLACFPLCGCPLLPTDPEYAVMFGGGASQGGGSGAEFGGSEPGERFDYYGDLDDSGTAIGAGVAVGLTDRVSAEISYVDFGEYSWEGNAPGGLSVGSVDTTGFRVGLSGRHPLSDSGFSLVGLGGLLVWEQEGDSTLDGAPQPKIDDDGTDLYLGGGLQYDIAESVKARLTLSRNFGVGDDEIDLAMLDLLFLF